LQLNQVRKRENKKAMKKKNQTSGSGSGSGSGDMDDKDQEWDIKKIMKDIEFFSNYIFLFLSLFSPFFKTILFFNVCYLLHYNYTLCIYEKVV
jgi:hypothetical protein